MADIIFPDGTKLADYAKKTGSTIVVADHGAAGVDHVVNVCYGTSATPPAASGTTEGTLYIQYTA